MFDGKANMQLGGIKARRSWKKSRIGWGT